MSDVTIELCGDRAIAEARKRQIKGRAPDADWKTRIIEDVSTTALFATQGASEGSTTQLKGQAEASQLGRSNAVVLIIWAE